MLLCFLSSLFRSITLLSGIVIDYHYNDPLLLPKMVKAWPIEDSYILLDDILLHTISYITVSLTLLFFFSCLIDHTSRHMTEFFSSVSFISFWRASSISKSLNSRSDMPACDSIFVNVIFSNTWQGRFSITKSFVDYLPPPSYHLHT